MRSSGSFQWQHPVETGAEEVPFWVAARSPITDYAVANDCNMSWPLALPMSEARVPPES